MMKHTYSRRASLCVVAVAWMASAAREKPAAFPGPSDPALRKPTGYAQLVSIQPLPGMENPMCEWTPASTQTRLVAALRQQQGVARSAQSSVETPTTTLIGRAPIREIRDEYPSYSAIAVDPIRDEIVLQDENLFSIMVFDRKTNTPPTARMSEPKRMIRGPKVNIQFNCGVYVDPKTGDIYSVSNDVQDAVVIFSREARGDVPPVRELTVPQRSWGIAVDEEREEMFITVQHQGNSGQVLVYRKTASGFDAPIRMLEGPRTQLADTHGIAVDSKSRLMFVTNWGSTSGSDRDGPGSGGSNLPPSITVYPLDATGNTPPLRVIQGDRTQLNWPAAVSVDEEEKELYVANDAGHSVLVFGYADSGNVAPRRVIQGPQTTLKNPSGVFVDTKNQEVVVSNLGNHSVIVFPKKAHGDVAPLRTIRSAPQGKQALKLGNPAAVAYDSKRDEILVPN